MAEEEEPQGTQGTAPNTASEGAVTGGATEGATAGGGRRRTRGGSRTPRAGRTPGSGRTPGTATPGGGAPTGYSEGEGEDLYDEEGGRQVFQLEDYRAIAALDRYESEGLAHETDVDEGDAGLQMQRRFQADAEMDRRDRRRARGLPGALEEDELQAEERDRRRRRLLRERMGVFGDLGGEEGRLRVSLEELKGPVRDHLESEPVREAVSAKFREFLRTATDDSGRSVFAERIDRMCAANRQTLEVPFTLLAEHSKVLAMWIVDAPLQVLPLFHKVARQAVLSMFPAYGAILAPGKGEAAGEAAGGAGEIFVRIADYPVVHQIRDIRQKDLGSLVKVTGVVTRRTGIFPKMSEVIYGCDKCGARLGPFTQSVAGDAEEVKPNICSHCQSPGPFHPISELTLYRNFQKMTIQEPPSSVPAGRLPRSKEVVLLDDLTDCARPGEEVEVTGVYGYHFDQGMLEKSGFPVFSTVVEANHVSKKADRFAAYALTEEDKEDIQRLRRDPRIGDRIIKSIAPSICGHNHIKTAIALSMFGGQEKVSQGRHRIRGDINVLMVGDPGVAKSQFLKYVEKTANRAVYTTGKGASAVGLTAAVRRDPVTREWTLEGGALVLADKGVCLIDEFDKMNDQDRVSIHEAMEQQSISISKAGIVTSLQARCAVIAAANPVSGRYEPHRTLTENVELTDPIISRFDILCVVRDKVDPVQDSKLAKHVLGNHVRNHPDYDPELPEHAHLPAPEEEDDEILSQDQLRKYVTFAKQSCRPRMTQAHEEKIARVYAELRRESMGGQGIPIAVRHLESIIRMGESHARMHLRDTVAEEDVDVAIRVMLESFIAAQKLSNQKQMERKFRKYITYKQDVNDLLLFCLRQLLREHIRFDAPASSSEYAIPVERLKEMAAKYHVKDVRGFLKSKQFQENDFKTHEGMITYPVV